MLFIKPFGTPMGSKPGSKCLLRSLFFKLVARYQSCHP